MGEGETATWKGPAQVSAGARRLQGVACLVWTVGAVWWFTSGGADGVSHWFGVIFTVNAVLWAFMVLPNGTTVKADRGGMRVLNPMNPSWRRVRWDEISHFERRAPWGARRKDLLVAIKHGGGRVLIGLPEGHEGLADWWARYRSQVPVDNRD